MDHIFNLEGILSHVVDTGKLNKARAKQRVDFFAHK